MGDAQAGRHLTGVLPGAAQHDRSRANGYNELGGLAGFGGTAGRAETSTDRRVTTLRAVVAYDGTDFYGMQYQPAQRTVTSELQRVFSKLLQHDVKITCAGRTDAGVHATGQVVSWKTEAAFPFERFTIAANSLLPGDVSVRSAAIVEDDFSARSSAVERTYVFVILNTREPSALLARYAYHVWSPIDLNRLRDSAAYLIGEHDFRSFCGMLPEHGPTTRTVTKLDAQRKGDTIRIEIRADGFLHRMVRTIVGSLVECAVGRREVASVRQMLLARDRAAAGLTAPAHGLYLTGVRYRGGFDSFAEPPITSGFV
jgi:tRNA pseudouridine38-40 synthase